MKRFPQYAMALTVILSTASLSSSVVWGSIDGSVTDPVAIAVAQAADNAKAAGVCVEVSLTAVENAMAAENDAEAGLMKAMRAGDKTRIRSAEKNVKSANGAAEEAREMAKKIMDCAAECAAVAVAAKAEEGKQRPEMTDRETASGAKKMGRLLETARQELSKAEAMTDVLKKKWLLPVIPLALTPVNAVPAQTLPLSSARADRR